MGRLFCLRGFPRSRHCLLGVPGPQSQLHAGGFRRRDHRFPFVLLPHRPTRLHVGFVFEYSPVPPREATFRLAISVPLAIAVGPISQFPHGSLCLAYLRPAQPACYSADAQNPSQAQNPMARFRLVHHRPSSPLRPANRPPPLFLDHWVRLCNSHRLREFNQHLRPSCPKPVFFPGAPVGLRYHYYWLIQSALVENKFADARQALIAGTIWCGIGLMATVGLFLRFFKIKGRKSSTTFAFALLLVTGLDILPALLFLVLYKCHLIGNLPPSMEWWNDQVDGWLYSVLFEPHYVAGLIACLFGFLLISKDRLPLAAVIAGFAFATSVGASIYIGFVFAIFLATWAAIALWKRWYAEFLALSIAGVTALVCSLPFLASLRGPGSGGAFLHWTVRPFFIVHNPFANLLLLPLNYFWNWVCFSQLAFWSGAESKRPPTATTSRLASWRWSASWSARFCVRA